MDFYREQRPRAISVRISFISVRIEEPLFGCALCALLKHVFICRCLYLCVLNSSWCMWCSCEYGCLSGEDCRSGCVLLCGSGEGREGVYYW